MTLNIPHPNTRHRHKSNSEAIATFMSGTGGEPSQDFKFGKLFWAVGSTLKILSAPPRRSKAWVQRRQHAPAQLAKSDRDGAWPLASASKNHGITILQKGALLILTDLQRLAAAFAELDQ